MYDLALIHAPSVYDFRGRDDVLFAYLSNSDSVHVSPIFEMPPVGVLSIEQHVRRSGYQAQFFNVASQMLRDPSFDVEAFFKKIPARYVGFDLHWLVHSHGSLELAKLYKQIHPTAKTVFGGISSTYFHQSLLEYDQVDYVVRGYDTLLPIGSLMASNDDPVALEAIPNLSWKRAGEGRHNPMTHVPETYSASVDWRQVFTPDRTNMTPYNIIIPQAGCEYNCRWCGGSRSFFSKYMGLEKRQSRVHKSPQVFREELASVVEATRGRHTLTTIDFWHEYEDLFQAAESVYVDNTARRAAHGAGLQSVHYSLHRLPSLEKAARMGNAVKAVIELSPDSSTFKISKASGRGKYTMDQMEAFIDALLGKIHSFEIYFMIGLPEQTVDSVLDDVTYCEHLLTKYRGKNVYPFICPMLPFLDPGSEISDDPGAYGYRLLHRGLEAHRQALVSLNWKHRLNFETKWMTRGELVQVSYEAVRRLTEAKVRHRQLPEAFGRAVMDRIDVTRGLLGELDALDVMAAGPERDATLTRLRGRVASYNAEQLAAVTSQQRPLDMGFSQQQWFDTDEAFQRVAAH